MWARVVCLGTYMYTPYSARVRLMAAMTCVRVVCASTRGAKIERTLQVERERGGHFRPPRRHRDEQDLSAFGSTKRPRRQCKLVRCWRWYPDLPRPGFLLVVIILSTCVVFE